METTNYEIKLEQFEGPFDLLLFFIERDELNIHDIPISKITDDFLGYIQKMNSFNIELAAEFIFVASTLMRIKAKMLLPRPDPEETEVDLREQLVQKLILYKQYKDICEDLKVLSSKRERLHQRGNITFDYKQTRRQINEEELASFDLYKLMIVYEKVMYNFTHRVLPISHTVVQFPYTIEQQKDAISALLDLNKKIDFQKILKNSENRVQFVFNFLAILEMLQQKLLEIEVGAGYNNFYVEKNQTHSTLKSI